MTKYRITWEEKQYWECVIEAKTMDEAWEHYKTDSDMFNEKAESVENEFISGTAKICEVDDE